MNSVMEFPRIAPHASKDYTLMPEPDKRFPQHTLISLARTGTSREMGGRPDWSVSAVLQYSLERDHVRRGNQPGRQNMFRRWSRRGSNSQTSVQSP
jgi:hypothetical protein